MGTKTGVRSVLEFAREVRVYLHNNEAVIVGSVVSGAGTPPDMFRILPWGTTSVVTIRLDEVLRAAPVHGMTWVRQRTICAAQGAGVFKRSSPLHAGNGRGL
jgi:hypothetical protein